MSRFLKACSSRAIISTDTAYAAVIDGLTANRAPMLRAANTTNGRSCGGAFADYRPDPAGDCGLLWR